MKNFNEPILLYPIQGEAEDLLGLKIGGRKELESICREVGAEYLKQQDSWILPHTTDNISAIINSFQHGDIFFESISKNRSRGPGLDLKEEGEISYYTFEACLSLKNYRAATISSYLYIAARFLYQYTPSQALDLSEEDIEHYLQTEYFIRPYSTSFKRQALGAIRLYYRLVLKRNLGIHLKTPGSSNPAMKLLTPFEVKEIIRHSINRKHRALLALIYYSALRVGECLNLRMSSFDWERKELTIRSNRKGASRCIPLHDELHPILKRYFSLREEGEYLFESPEGGMYSSSSARKILKNAMKRAEIEVPVTLHSLRHSRAIHLLYFGHSISEVAKLLGLRNKAQLRSYENFFRTMDHRYPVES